MEGSRWLTLARFAWLALAVGHWILWLTSLPAFLTSAAAGTIPTVAPPGGPVQISNELVRQWAAAWRLSPAAWAWLDTALAGVSVLVFTLVAGLICVRVRTWFGWFTAVVLLGGYYPIGHAVYAAHAHDAVARIYELGALGWPFFFLWLYLFPDGRPVPGRLRWLLLPALALFMAAFASLIFAPGLPVSPQVLGALATLTPLGVGLIALLFLMVLGAQIYRYLRVSGPLERLQTRWFVHGLALSMGLSLVLQELVGTPPGVGSLLFALLPISVGVCILRYRLWDVDVIIRRTLVYAGVSAILALVYFGCVLLLQRIFSAVAGQQSPAAIVLSTLLSAALFAPLRSRLQVVVDRRFYRRKYDTERALGQFAEAARDETDLESLSGRLVQVVEETMQPEGASISLVQGPGLVRNHR